ncbi:MAG: hypothetical protein PWQ57_3356 [Desulfovibrionales bacterium]|nr:hypothetical protein [Desulfovibrionales bacterium]
MKHNHSTQSGKGFWVMVEDWQYFVPFSDYPMFKGATAQQLNNVKLSPGKLHWPDLDANVDLRSL